MTEFSNGVKVVMRSLRLQILLSGGEGKNPGFSLSDLSVRHERLTASGIAATFPRALPGPRSTPATQDAQAELPVADCDTARTPAAGRPPSS